LFFTREAYSINVVKQEDIGHVPVVAIVGALVGEILTGVPVGKAEPGGPGTSVLVGTPVGASDTRALVGLLVGITVWELVGATVTDEAAALSVGTVVSIVLKGVDVTKMAVDGTVLGVGVMGIDVGAKVGMADGVAVLGVEEGAMERIDMMGQAVGAPVGVAVTSDFK
jgi:hypothetical protein